MVALFLPRTGLAHTLGLSVAELDVTPEGPVAAHITFASAEPLGGTPLRDEDLKSFVAQGVDVSADGTHCEGTFEGSSVTEADGLRLDAMYDCPVASHVEVTLYYLSALSPGHREVARIVASGASVEGLLTGERRALGLDIPGRVPRTSAHASTGRRLVGLTAVFAVFMAALFVWRWRATRRRDAGLQMTEHDSRTASREPPNPAFPPSEWGEGGSDSCVKPPFPHSDGGKGRG